MDTSKNTAHNLLAPFDSNRWETRVHGLAPAFERIEENGQTLLKIDANGEPDSFGKWVSTIQGIQSGQAFKFSVQYETQQVKSDSVSVIAILTWRKGNERVIQRDYAEQSETAAGRWQKLSRLVEVPAEADQVTIELGLRWPGQGHIIWSNAVFAAIDPIGERNVRVATALLRLRKVNHRTLDFNLSKILEAVDKAAESTPDIICLGEKTYDDGVNLPHFEKAETIPGRLTNALGEKAKQHQCYIIISMTEKSDQKLYNTAVLLDRQGEIVGKYRKTHLTLSEAEAGYVPGDEYPVFETDFGKIGIMICWDQVFPEVSRILRMNGAEIIFIPTQGDALVQTAARAKDNGVYIVASGIYRSSSSRIVDLQGEIIAQVPEEEEETGGTAIADLDLNKRYYTRWLSVGPGNGEGRVIYDKERRPDTYEPIQQG